MNYVLGYPDKINVKATMGTTTHKNLEILGKIRIAGKGIEDEDLGKIRKNIKIEDLNAKSFEYYFNLFPGVMERKHEKICLDWTNKAITYKNGKYDPRKQNIHAVEEFFDIEIKKDWAKYKFERNGEIISGYLSLRGTVDVILKEDDVFFHVQDYKGLPVETPILTTKGWSTMGQIEVGDYVFDRFWQPTEVIGKSKASVKECYRIYFEDCEVVCDFEHKWKLSHNDVVPVRFLKAGDKIDNVVDGGTREVLKIEQVDPCLTQCISVDSPDNTFLCTRKLIPTHNTGRRYDWASDTVKTFEKLCKDDQLRLYYYALRLKYPDKRFLVSIYYINDHKINQQIVPGGYFTVPFDDTDFYLAEQEIRKIFEEIKNNNKPTLLNDRCSHWKCKYLCAYSQIIPEIDKEKPACLAIRDHISQHGIQATTEKFADFSKLNTYSGGGRTDVKLEKD